MPWMSTTATPVVIISAHEPLSLSECISEFLKRHILNTRSRGSVEQVRFITTDTLPPHGLQMIEFFGFSEHAVRAINSSMEGFRDSYLPERSGGMLIVVNPATSHMVAKL